MMTLVYPKEDENTYLFWLGSCFGPFSAKYDFLGNRISFRGQIEAMSEKKNIYGENDVVHDKFSGDFEYHPLIADATPVPTTQLPLKISVPVVTYNGQNTTKYADYGFAVNHNSSMGYVSALKTQAFQWAFSRHPVTNNWIIYKVQSVNNSPTKINGYVIYKISFIESYSGDAKRIYYTMKTYNLGTSGVETGINWLAQQSYDTITSLDLSGSTSQETAGTAFGYIYTRRYTSVEPPSTCKQKIDGFVANLFQGSFPLTDKHYGDLALEASEKIVANSNNMLEFFSDLRHPSKMVPTLKNLKSLKGLSSNFLAIKYGILPTIDDLKAIYEAFNKRKPYYDKNGFSTYSAGHLDSTEVDDIKFELEQHIKLAIDHEDAQYKVLMNKLDDMGMFPSLSNIWDLVKYSFVIDWFIDVGDFLEKVDFTLSTSRRNIRYVTSSRKTRVSGNSTGNSSFPFVGTADWVHYHRWVSDQCPAPPFSTRLGSNPIKHWLEGLALIIQRKK